MVLLAGLADSPVQLVYSENSMPCQSWHNIDCHPIPVEEPVSGEVKVQVEEMVLQVQGSVWSRVAQSVLIVGLILTCFSLIYTWAHKIDDIG